ncbi:hypothetical protein OVA29_17325 [Exiguobacterium sp. SL14]|nr:enolase C-terminal domain-like protein [Exiguobacterium sp. SL14]MCY1692134.1 hypothetical protein [Exiguobacterium sp. SL14]
MKLAPTDTAVLEQVRSAFPDAPLMFDANGGFTEADFPLLQHWDSFGLVMMEQPLATSDWSGHQRLATLLKTPICLDESIVAPADADLMKMTRAGQILNIKPARVGGLTNALSLRTKAPYWLGGMFESGIGRRQTLAFATLPVSLIRLIWQVLLITLKKICSRSLIMLNMDTFAIQPRLYLKHS